MLSRNDSDFIIGSNGHARLSHAKVGELLKVSQQAISKLTRTNNLGFSESPEMLAQYGFDGNNLAVLVEYYAFDSRQASQETIAQCRKIYRQAAAKSFQDFIDALAGIDTQQSQQQPQLAFDTRIRLEVELIQSVLTASGIDRKLVAGVALNHAGIRLPAMREAVNEAHALLAASAPLHLLMTPTAIGQELGISARQVNLLLLDIGYQVKNLNKTKDAPAYLPTDIGQPYAANTLATGKLYENGADNTTYQHLKWKSQVVEILREQMIEVDCS